VPHRFCVTPGGKKQRKQHYFQCPGGDELEKCGFKWSASRRERATVNDLIALGSGYQRDPISPSSQERNFKHPWDLVES